VVGVALSHRALNEAAAWSVVMTFAYTVSAYFDDEATAQEWSAWMREQHLADVVAAGALSAVLVRLTDTRPRLESRYEFASAQAFADYEAAHAPRLRAESAARFPPTRGVRLVRSMGEVLAEVRAPASGAGKP
jgi:Domain of unknown function (DUF4286)